MRDPSIHLTIYLQEVNPSLAEAEAVEQTVAVGCSLMRSALGKFFYVLLGQLAPQRPFRRDAAMSTSSRLRHILTQRPLYESYCHREPVVIGRLSAFCHFPLPLWRACGTAWGDAGTGSRHCHRSPCRPSGNQRHFVSATLSVGNLRRKMSLQHFRRDQLKRALDEVSIATRDTARRGPCGET